jgi:hypothetical protein
MSKKLWTVFTIATTISITVTSILSFYLIPALALSNNNLFFNNDWSTDWIKQCISSTVNSANINNNLAKGGSIVGSSVFASSNQPALYCSQQLQAYISQISSWLQQCTAAALTSGGFGGGSSVFANAITYCTYLLQLTQNNNFLTQNQINDNNNNNNNGGITTTPFPQANGGITTTPFPQANGGITTTPFPQANGGIRTPTYSTNGTPGFYTAVGHHHCLEGSAGCICTDPHKCSITTTPFLRQSP